MNRVLPWLVAMASATVVQAGGFDSRVSARLNRAMADFCRDPFSKAVFMVKAGLWTLGPNLAPNPGFEEVWGEGRYADLPEGEEWRRGIAHGWGISPHVLDTRGRIDTMTYASRHARFEWRAGRMRDLVGRSYYLRDVPGIQPGKAYLCRIHVLYRVPRARIPPDPGVYMQVRWRGDGKWIREPSYIARLHETGTWRVLETVAVAPETAASANVFLFAGQMDSDQDVLFDNLSVQLIQETSTSERSPD